MRNNVHICAALSDHCLRLLPCCGEKHILLAGKASRAARRFLRVLFCEPWTANGSVPSHRNVWTEILWNSCTMLSTSAMLQGGETLGDENGFVPANWLIIPTVIHFNIVKRVISVEGKADRCSSAFHPACHSLVRGRGPRGREVVQMVGVEEVKSEEKGKEDASHYALRDGI